MVVHDSPGGLLGWPQVATLLHDHASIQSHLDNVSAQVAQASRLHVKPQDVAPVDNCRPLSTCGVLASSQGCIDLCMGSDPKVIGIQDASVGKVVAYLPTPAMRQKHEADARTRDVQAQVLLAEVRRLQFPSDVSRHDELFLFDLPFDGLIAMTQQVAQWLSWAFMNNRTFWPGLDHFDAHLRGLRDCASTKNGSNVARRADGSRSSHAAGGGSAQESGSLVAPPDAKQPAYECVFEPMVGCLWPAQPERLLPMPTERRWMQFTSVLAQRLRPLQYSGTDDRISFGPLHGEFRQHGGFWFRSTLLGFTFRLRSQLADDFSRERASIGFASPIIGMHIRRGDKCRNAKKGPLIPAGLCHSTEPFMRAAEKLQDTYGVTSIFLATDDPDAIAACRRTSRFRCISFDDQSRGSNTLRGNDTLASLSVLREVDTIAHCDFFVGTLGRSSVSTVAYELLVARRGGAHVPFVSFGTWAWGSHGF